MTQYQWYRPNLANAVGVWLVLYYLTLIPVRYGLKGVPGLYGMCHVILLSRNNTQKYEAGRCRGKIYLARA
jgi:hypothetical protein